MTSITQLLFELTPICRDLCKVIEYYAKRIDYENIKKELCPKIDILLSLREIYHDMNLITECNLPISYLNRRYNKYQRKYAEKVCWVVTELPHYPHMLEYYDPADPPNFGTVNYDETGGFGDSDIDRNISDSDDYY